jgi:hypothetical protein
MPPRLALLAVALFIVEFFDAPTIANLFAFISIFLLCSSLNRVSPILARFLAHLPLAQ